MVGGCGERASEPKLVEMGLVRWVFGSTATRVKGGFCGVRYRAVAAGVYLNGVQRFKAGVGYPFRLIICVHNVLKFDNIFIVIRIIILASPARHGWPDSLYLFVAFFSDKRLLKDPSGAIFVGWRAFRPVVPSRAWVFHTHVFCLPNCDSTMCSSLPREGAEAYFRTWRERGSLLVDPL